MKNNGIDISNFGPNLRLVSIEPNKHMFYGYPYGSCMDYKTVLTINQILRKQQNSKVLECSLKGCKLHLYEDLNLCIGGALMAWELDGKSISHYQIIKARAGQILSAGFAKEGLRSYLAFSKDIELMNENHLRLSEAKVNKSMNVQNQNFTINKELVIYRGPEWNLLEQESKEKMMNYKAQISQDLSRIGVYLNGESIQIKSEFPKQSVCTFPGVIQLLPNGQLLVLAQDAQTTGGYPRIAYLDRNNLADFNQIGIGEELNWNLNL